MASSKDAAIFFIFYCCSLGSGLSRPKRQYSNCDNRSNFLCPSGECLAKAEVCDGKAQCSDAADETVLSCDCGTSLLSSEQSNGNASSGVRDVDIGTRPWHVGIYTSTRVVNHHNLLCSGALIYSDIVITSASCVFDIKNHRKKEASTLKISAGKLKKIYSYGRPNQQNFNVSEVVLLDRYDGDIKGYARNLALLRLNKAARTDFYVRPICLWANNDLPSGVSRVTMTGWGLQFVGNFGVNLREATVDILDVNTCLRLHSQPLNKRFLTHDKFCIIFDQGVGMKDDDIGGPLSFMHGGRHYLAGVLSVKVPGVNTFGIATRLSKYINWVRNTTYNLKLSSRCSTDDFECDGECVNKIKMCDGHRDCWDASDELPANCLKKSALAGLQGERCEMPDDRSIYEVSDCKSPTGCDKVSVYAPHLTIFNVRCPLGYGFEDPTVREQSTICVDGKWLPEIRNPCLKLCNQLNNTLNESLELQCMYRGTPVSCYDPLHPGTKITVKCRTDYTQPRGYFPSKMECTDGHLSNQIKRCLPRCGQENVDVDYKPLIINGTSSPPGKAPWHVALYSKNGDQWEYICGGSIVESNLVLTAAHCLFGPSIPDPNSYKVVTGKYHSSFGVRDDAEQRFHVKEIIMGDYQGQDTRFLNDVALLVLDTGVKYDAYNMPVCLDFEGLLPLNKPAHVVGWGWEFQSERPADLLKGTEMKYLDVESCKKQHGKGQLSFLLSDKFCLEYVNGSGVESGDSGGGVTIKQDNLHYLYGVVSHKKQNQTVFAIATDLTYSAHREWLKKLIQNKRIN